MVVTERVLEDGQLEECPQHEGQHGDGGSNGLSVQMEYSPGMVKVHTPPVAFDQGLRG